MEAESGSEGTCCTHSVQRYLLPLVSTCKLILYNITCTVNVFELQTSAGLIESRWKVEGTCTRYKKKMYSVHECTHMYIYVCTVCT